MYKPTIPRGTWNTKVYGVKASIVQRGGGDFEIYRYVKGNLDTELLFFKVCMVIRILIDLMILFKLPNKNYRRRINFNFL